MEILLLIVIVLLSFIAYKLNKLEKVQIANDAMMGPLLSTSLNPLFSEKEISSQRSLSEKWQQKVEFYFNLLQRTEKEEIKEHQNSGRDKSEFAPSGHLKNIIQQLTIAINGRDATQTKASRMIEANISILNGKAIAEVSEQFYSEKDRISWGNTNLSSFDEKFISAAYGEKIKREYDEGLLGRSEFWQNNWDSILKDTSSFEEPA